MFNSTTPPSPESMGFYFSFLQSEKQFQELRRKWSEAWAAQGPGSEEYETGENYVWNGHFERPLASGVLDWTIRVPDGVKWSLDRHRENGFSTALKLEFDGNHNLEFNGLTQQVVVGAARQYRFSFRARADRISTDQGLFLQITDVGRRVLFESDQVNGTVPWREYTGAFLLSENIQVLQLWLRRNQSRRIDSLISGTFFLDDVRLAEVGEAD